MTCLTQNSKNVATDDESYKKLKHIINRSYSEAIKFRTPNYSVKTLRSCGRKFRVICGIHQHGLTIGADFIMNGSV